jgi:hypothetical protein
MAEEPIVVIPKDLQVPDTLVNPHSGVIPKKKKIKWSVMQIDAMLMKHTDSSNTTNRQAAADEMGMSRNNLDVRIANTPLLLSRWGRTATMKHIRDEMKKLGEVDEHTDMAGMLNKSIDIHLAGTGSVAIFLIDQIKSLIKKIELHEAARLMDENDPKYQETRKHLFILNDKGEPKEEEMVRANLEKLTSQYMKGAEIGIGAALTKSKIASVLCSGKGGGLGGGGGGEKRGLGVAPKGSRPVAPATAFIDARGANVLVTSNGNGNTNGGGAGNPQG